LWHNGWKDLKNLQHFCNKMAGNGPKSPQITGNQLEGKGNRKTLKPLWLKGFIW